MQRIALLLIALILGGNGWSADSQQPPQAYQINAQQKPQGNFKTEGNPGEKNTNPGNSATAMPAAKAVDKKTPSESVAYQSNKDIPSEFWDLGSVKVKVTDFFLVFFTLAIAVITGILAYYTKQLWGSTEQNAIWELRAYINPITGAIFDGTNFKPIKPGTEDVPSVDSRFVNSGKTPAYKVRGKWNMDVIEIGKEKTLKISMRLGSPFDVGAGQVFPRTFVLTRKLTEIEKAGITASPATHAIYFFGRYEYEDVFGNCWFTNFRFSYTGIYPPPQNAPLNISKRGNECGALKKKKDGKN